MRVPQLPVPDPKDQALAAAAKLLGQLLPALVAAWATHPDEATRHLLHGEIVRIEGYLVEHESWTQEEYRETVQALVALAAGDLTLAEFNRQITQLRGAQLARGIHRTFGGPNPDHPHTRN